MQVAKSIQMAMGLHDKDVAFFLAADEPATYLQVQATASHTPGTASNLLLVLRSCILLHPPRRSLKMVLRICILAATTVAQA